MIKLVMIKNMNIKKLKEIAEKYHMSQLDICKKLDISVSTWNRWIIGKCVPKSKNTLKQIDKVIKKYSS